MSADPDPVADGPLGRANAWERFWFEPRSIAPLVLVRIGLGLTISLWAATLLPDATAFLGPEGVLPEVPEVRIRSGILQLWRTDAAAITVVALLIPAGLAVAAGAWTRIATVLSFVLLLSIGRRNPYMMNSGDALLRHATLFLALTPAGQVLSLDRWRRHRDRFWQVPELAPWGLRLLQIQLTFVYLFSSFEKLRGMPWLQGTALADAWRITDLARFGVPLPVYDSLLMTQVLTYATLVIEVALAVLLWNRRARPFVVVAGILLHLGIEVTMAVGFFSTVAVILYLSFTPPEVAERWIEVLRWWLSGGPRSAPRTPDRSALGVDGGRVDRAHQD
ncbi:MAG: HTTM domain-containing protein [Nitriliruptor sp.]